MTQLGLMSLFLIKHFVADFPLQTPYMLGKSRRTDWVGPLLAHTGLHAFLTFLLLLSFGAALAFWFAVLEGILHFYIDRIKAHPDWGGRWGTTQPQFWIALGADQLAHGLTYVLIVRSLPCA